uniref:Uncharacterized protein n=1 Tax=Plectus sambesii TaxID=2011161 RepID=A0A914WAI8_9BILA
MSAATDRAGAFLPFAQSPALFNLSAALIKRSVPHSIHLIPCPFHGVNRERDVRRRRRTVGDGDDRLTRLSQLQQAKVPSGSPKAAVFLRGLQSMLHRVETMQLSNPFCRFLLVLCSLIAASRAAEIEDQEAAEKRAGGFLTANQVLPGNYFGKRVGMIDRLPTSEDYEWLMSAGKRDVEEAENDSSKRSAEDNTIPGVLRFGKKSNSELPSGLRFGKRAQSFIRFGKRQDKKDMPGVLRFGKRDDGAMPGVLRFGKKSDIPGVLRFGKRDDGAMPGVLRFGKKSDIPGVLRFGKRGDSDMPGVLRFGKRDMPGVLRFGKRDDIPGVLRFGRR